MKCILSLLYSRCKKKLVQTNLGSVEQFNEEELNKRIIRFLIDSSISFHALEKKSFRDIIAPTKLKVWSTKRIKETIILEGKKTLERIKKEANLCLVVDEYKDINNNSIYNIACRGGHGFYFIESVESNGDGRAESIVELIKDCFDRNGISFEKICASMTDNCPVMIKTSKIIENIIDKPVIAIGCMAHILNIMIHK